MQTHRTSGKAGRDGVLHLDVPVDTPDAEFKVVVVLQPGHHASPSPTSPPEALGWPPHFIEKTAGSIQDPTFRRPDQGEFEGRTDF